MKGFSPKFRIGNGYDIHRLVKDRDLILGGIKLHHPENLGLDGHSDADVLSHSISDALLGALSLGDIGKYFPPNDDKWKNADSLFLLSKIVALVRNQGWQINNVDSVIIAERPKFRPYIDSMKQNIANILRIEDCFVGNFFFFFFFISFYYILAINCFSNHNYNVNDAEIIEELRLKVPFEFKEIWLQSEKDNKPWLSNQNGFRRQILEYEEEEH